MPIRIPDDDAFYSKFQQKCMDFKRSVAGLRPGCALGSRVHINTITATIDANPLYGSTKRVADQLREFAGGRLRVNDAFGGARKPLLPPQVVLPELDCFERPDSQTYCFLGGDERVNEQPTLTVLHTLYVRDHNRVARQLEALNPHWDDDRIYHETRHIEAAIVQHMLFNEYLPMLLGANMMDLFNLTLSTGFWSGYDPSVSPAISNGFSTAAFRQGHTFIQGKMQLHDPVTHAYLGYELLRNLFKRPFHYYNPGRLDQVLTGIINTPAQTYDRFITEEIGGHLFQEPGRLFGMDLPAINMARAREQGVPGYNLYREWCGLPRARTFDDLAMAFQNRTLAMYKRLYKHPDDIDLWSGGVSERRMPGAQIGPTFACIIARQFSNLKKGDRFWYENGNLPSSFTLNQLQEIKKATQARLLCKNSDQITMIQRKAFLLPHPVHNPRVPCSQIAELDLRFWREDPKNPGSFECNC